MDEIITIVSFLVGLTIAIIVIVAIGYLYSTKKKASFQAEESRKLMQLLSDGKIDQATYERLRMNLEKEETYRKELEQLEGMLSFEKIDQATYERMVKELKEKYQKT